MTRGGGEDRARDDQIGEAARDGQAVEESVRDAGAVSVIGPRELSLKYRPQAGRGLDSHHLPPPFDELKRQAPGAGADLDNPVRAARQPGRYPWMQTLGAGQLLVQVRLEPVQQLPRQRVVIPRIAGTVSREASCLTRGQDP